GASDHLAIVVDPGRRRWRGGAQSIQDGDRAGSVADECGSVLSDAGDIAVIIDGGDLGGLHTRHIDGDVGSIGMAEESVPILEWTTVDIGSDDIAGVCDASCRGRIRTRKANGGYHAIGRA